MTRLMFGGGPADVYLIPDDDGDLHRGGGYPAYLFDAEVGGAAYTDLEDINHQPVTSVTTSTGSDGRAAGQLPPFYGPDGVFELWVAVGTQDAPRFIMAASNLGSFLGPIGEQAVAHFASAHATNLAGLADVANDLAPDDGAVLVFDETSGLWIAGAAVVGGGGGDVTLGTDQTFTGQKTFTGGAVDKSRVILEAAATGQAGDLFVAYSGTDTGQGGARQRTTYLNEKGELRCIAAKTSSVAGRFKGQPGQTANIVEITDTANTPKAWVGPDYAFRAPNLGRSLVFTVKGNVAAGTGTFKWTNDTGVPMLVRSIRLTAATAPTGQALIVDVNLNGITIFATQANRPTINASFTNSGKVTGFSTNSIPDTGVITVDVDQVGSTGAGADLTVQIELW